MNQIYSPEANSIKENLHKIETTIANTAELYGRDPKDITLLPITKNISSPNIMKTILEYGYKQFGENKTQEIVTKNSKLSGQEIPKWVFIGHLQSNKAKYIAKYVHELQTLDSTKLAHHLQHYLETENRVLNTFIQINITRETNKYGILPENIEPFIEKISIYKNIKIVGLMAMGNTHSNDNQNREHFRKIYQLRDKLIPNLPTEMSLNQLSMGMSNDYKLAIAEGSTLIRIGKAIFNSK